MHNHYRHYPLNEQRFIGPLLPFVGGAVGGALIGYTFARPNNTYYQPYYPQYYPIYYPYPYYQTTNYIN